MSSEGSKRVRLDIHLNDSPSHSRSSTAASSPRERGRIAKKGNSTGSVVEEIEIEGEEEAVNPDTPDSDSDGGEKYSEILRHVFHGLTNFGVYSTLPIQYLGPALRLLGEAPTHVMISDFERMIDKESFHIGDLDHVWQKMQILTLRRNRDLGSTTGDIISSCFESLAALSLSDAETPGRPIGLEETEVSVRVVKSLICSQGEAIHEDDLNELIHALFGGPKKTLTKREFSQLFV